tara:strand:- start:1361 stop:2488 length:1128 start_codon:yes stop_codon:yes gene_type:complete
MSDQENNHHEKSDDQNPAKLNIGYFEEATRISNYAFYSFLKDNSIEQSDQEALDREQRQEWYATFLISNLNTLPNRAKTRNFLHEQASITHDAINWLKAVRSFMKDHFRENPELDLDHYADLDKVIETVIDEFEIMHEKQTEWEKERLKVYEMPIDKDDHRYSIKRKDVQRHTTKRIEKNPEVFKGAYFEEVSSRLSGGISSVEIIPFLKHQLKYIEHKQEWLSYVNNSMNSSNRERNPHPKSNDSLMMELIPNLIKEVINEEEGDLEELYKSKPEKIKTDLTAAELRLLFRIFLESGYIKEVYDISDSKKEKRNKTALARLVTNEFSSKNKGDLSEITFRNSFDTIEQNTFVEMKKIILKLEETRLKLHNDAYK